MKTSAAASLAIIVALVISGCTERQTTVGQTTIVAEANDIGALAPAKDGGFFYAERATGTIYAVSYEGVRRDEPVATIPVSTEGQRGVIGLAVDDAGVLFAAWTRADGDQNIEVGRIADGVATPIWTGPKSSDVANGGHIAFRKDGRLVLGIGDLREQATISDPNTLNGKLLALDPAGAVDQKPELISGGWNNPFAFTITEDDEIWVADNSPGTDERLARGDVDGKPTQIQIISEQEAPSGVTEGHAGDLFVCTYNARKLQGYRQDGKWEKLNEPVATDCSTGVITLADGRLVYAGVDDIKAVTLR